MKEHFKTIVLSDLHLGTSGSKAKEVTRFLKRHTCDLLILNGDIIDGWQLKKFGKWKKKHTRFFKQVLKMVEKHDTEVIYLRGNHDDFLDQIIPIELGKIKIQKDYEYNSFGKKYYIVHGDIFDSITTNLKWVAKLGDLGYTLLLWTNKLYNNWRTKRGLPYYSLSQKIKQRVKKAVQFIDDFEIQLAEVAKIKECDGIICGHIHQPANKFINDVHYLNSGDWVETLSALVETETGEWRLVYYTDSAIYLPTPDDEMEEEMEEKDINLGKAQAEEIAKLLGELS